LLFSLQHCLYQIFAVATVAKCIAIVTPNYILRK
jgi:hypothetical protein